ncbi:hypothetical protein DFH07DRAFT_785614 [Mycena maculata]|uniref:Uncharacterized protein n=1 Tax=Mycena maculata TaxID=230809 RepID=A0AAD7MGM3_9AGAR|nr:hypothetical protein DFH07DRAFT_785614 [Mycena maculata]
MYTFSREKVTRPDTDEDITELLSVPHIPIIIPDSLGTGNNIPVPPHLSDPSTPLTEILNTGDPEACDPEDTPAPEGIVELFLEEMLATVKDQTERHGQPECYNKHKTFWILQPDLWFTLEEYKSLSDFQTRCCPETSRSGVRIVMGGWAQAAGTPILPLAVLYFKCGGKSVGCKQSCSLYHDKILAQLLVHLRNKFPGSISDSPERDRQEFDDLDLERYRFWFNSPAWEKILRESRSC